MLWGFGFFVHKCRENSLLLWFFWWCPNYHSFRLLPKSNHQSIKGRYDTMFLKLPSIFLLLWSEGQKHFFTIFPNLLWYMYSWISSKMQLLNKSEHLLVIESMWLWFMTQVQQQEINEIRRDIRKSETPFGEKNEIKKEASVLSGPLHCIIGVTSILWYSLAQDTPW